LGRASIPTLQLPIFEGAGQQGGLSIIGRAQAGFGFLVLAAVLPFLPLVLMVVPAEEVLRALAEQLK
jgi:hypothetical protein